ncbi:MAG: metallophosphoesterase family protein [Bacteroidales bacterium]|nr:metallophosphoesterase family protein [Candidatus Cacconaster merdequi]
MSLLTVILASLINFIVTCPGEDASHSINVNWHTDVKGSYMELTDSRDTAFLSADKIYPKETLWSTDCCDSLFAIERYVCKVNMDNLKKGHSYIYRICAADTASGTYHFTTANGSRKWTFNAFTDFQTRFNPYTHNLIRLIDSIAGHSVLSVCSGDMIDYAAHQDEWEWLFGQDDIFSRFIYASSPGDHEYWGLPYPNGHIEQLKSPLTYNAIFNFPQNGTDCCKGSNYWFIYNRVLFLSLDCGDSNTPVSENSKMERDWIIRTAKELEGRYDYLIVLQHKSLMSSYTNDSGVHKYLTPLWVPAYVEAGVDLVLSGHDHMYSRTHEIDGVWYLDMGSSGRKTRVPDEGQYTDGLHDKIINLRELDQCVGAVVSVSRKCLDIKVYNRDGELVDQFKVKAKRRR